MSLSENVVIRDPNNFSQSPYVIGRNKYPHQISIGGEGVRNSNISKFQSFIPYASTTKDVSGLLNKKSERCNPYPFVMKTPLFKTAVDVFGNQYYLFKDVKDTISKNREAVGILKILDKNGVLYEYFGDLQIEDITTGGTTTNGIGKTITNIDIYFEMVVFTAYDTPNSSNVVYLGNARSKSFQQTVFQTLYTTTYYDGKLHLLYDYTPDDYGIRTFDGNDLITLVDDISPTPLIDVALIVLHNRYEVIGVKKVDKTINIITSEFGGELVERELDGSFLEYKMLGVYKQKQNWVVCYEGMSGNPVENFVGAFVIELAEIVKVGKTRRCGIEAPPNTQYNIDGSALDIVWKREYRGNVVW